MQATEALRQASALEDKTQHLAFIAVLAAVGAETGMPFHAALVRAAERNVHQRRRGRSSSAPHTTGESASSATAKPRVPMMDWRGGT